MKNLKKKNGATWETAKKQISCQIKEPRLFFLLGTLVVSVVGFASVVFCTYKYGAGVSHDSVEYVAAARNFLATKTFLGSSNNYILWWPPMYPFLIAIFIKLCQSNILLAVRLLNAVLFSLIIFLSGMWILRRFKSLFFAILACVCVLLSRPLFEVSCWVWSEPLFVLGITAFFVLLPYVLEEPTLKRILALAAVTAVACMTRYIGVVLVPTGGLALLIFNRRQSWLKNMFLAAFWGLLSILPLSLWILRNWFFTGSPTGPRWHGETTLLKNIILAGDVLLSWFFPPSLARNIPGGFFFCLFYVLLVIAVISTFYKAKKLSQFKTGQTAVLLLFVFLYTVAILHATTALETDPMSNRYLSPLYVPVVFIVLSFVAQSFYSQIPSIQTNVSARQKLIRLGVLFGIGMGVWFVTGLDYAVDKIQKAFVQGVGGRTGPTWEKSETIAWLRENNLKGLLYSNDPQSVYYLTYLNSKILPSRPDYFKNLSAGRGDFIEKTITDFKSSIISEQPVYLVWFKLNWRKNLYNPEQLQTFGNLQLIKELKDGYIIRIYP